MPPELEALIAGSRDAVRRVIVDLRERAGAAEQLRAAEHRAFMAEQREVLASLARDAAARIAEVRDGRDGLDGKDGEPGADGRNGIDGKDGVDGAPGIDGAPGQKGPQGPAGNDGKDGADGRDGIDGAPGRDGIDGKDGDRGTDGKDGADGAPGADGKDGLRGKDVDVALLEDGRTVELTFGDGEIGYAFNVQLPIIVDRGDHQVGRAYEEGDAVSFDGALWIAQQATTTAPGSSDWRLAVSRGADGANGKDGTDGADGTPGLDAYPGEARGLFDPEAAYRALDVVTFNGSEWRAKRDDPGDLPGDGWMLSASRGKRGDRGERGPAGNDGADAAGILAGFVDQEELKLILTKEDGSEIKVDLYDLATLIKNA